jgi:2-polyprenyl-6-hydroxyphenyl methylase/3-demethylubiquinone-9 3-methyltransferase
MLAKSIYDAGLGLQTGAIGWLALYRGAKPNYPPMPTRGLFRLCRQPIYLAFALTLWTVPTWTPDQLAIAIPLTAYCLVGPILKEKRFGRRFGDEFERYRSRHSYFLPWPPRAQRNDLSIYDHFASHWWDGSVRWLRVLQNLVPARIAYFDTVVDWKDKRVLDLGCGGGFMAEALAKRGAFVTGLDPASRAIKIAQAHAAERGIDIDYLVGGGESLPFGGGHFDAVVCVDVLEHVENLDRVLAEIHRVLRPGGQFLFDTINRNGLARFILINLAEDLLRLVPRGTHDPAKFIKPGEITKKLRSLGFDVMPPVGLGPRGLNKRLDIVFGPMPTPTIMFMGAARKPLST